MDCFFITKHKKTLSQRGRLFHIIKLRGVMKTRHIALVAHDNKKQDLLDWCILNKDLLSKHHLYATGNTGLLIQNKIELPITKFLSGPMGGDQQIGASISEGIIDVLIFFWDPLEAQPHDPDIKALLRLATLWNVGIAVNQFTASMIISSPLFEK
jgi:methylglyoxal synthase